LWAKKTFPARIPQDSLGFFFFLRNFSQEPTFGADPKIPVFGHVHRNFSQETGIPVLDPNSSGFLRIPQDSSGFLFPPKLKPKNKIYAWHR
jgi:hypothetical protein